ncbi:MAG: RagB/SusD family nutrient uptake outer membrane protein [Prevotella sp.]|nr:RagB/SusD family nutrient uptake outer membrane protein [Prevotella sp.]
MKTRYFFHTLITVPVAALTLTSCLSENPRSAIEEESAYQDINSLELSTLASIYNYIGGSSDCQGLQGTFRGVYDLNTFTTDEAILPTRGGDWYDGELWQNLYYHAWTESDAPFEGTWNYLYKVVMMCNRHIKTITDHKDILGDFRAEIDIAELRAVRAMYYFYIMDLWGNIPVTTDADTDVEEVKQLPRAEVFRFIVSELQETCDLLPDYHSSQQGSFYGRMTRPVVWFLLAKLMLNAEVYADSDWTDGARLSGKDLLFNVNGKQMNAWEACIYYCNQLEIEGGYMLEDHYGNNFSTHNEGSRENIFTIPMDKLLYTNMYMYAFRSRHYAQGSAMGMAAENGTSATLSTVKAYGYGTPEIDKRWYENFFYEYVYVNDETVKLADGTPLYYEPTAVAVDLTGSPYEKTGGARMRKYEPDMLAYADGKLQSNDIVLFRFGDAVLMRAEAEVRNGGDGSADLNSIRERAEMPTREATLDNILTERLLELMWEGWRRNDLIRFDRFHTSYDMRPQLANEGDRHTIVFPIPSDALAENKNLKQNPGY